ncbi:hypothetical protein Q7P37_006894 [Cladosporium fusiforme]
MNHRAATWMEFGAICRRSLTTLTAARSSARHQLIPNYIPPGHQYLASQAARGRKLPKNHFTSNRPLRQDNGAPPQKESKRKGARSQAASTSLRRVAVEAQRSREGLVRGKGKNRHVDPVAETKDVTAYCAAEIYQIATARQLLAQEGFHPDPCKTDLFPQVLHVQTPNFISKDEHTGENKEQGVGDVFVFPSGSVVTWNVPEHIGNNIVSRIIRPAAENSHQMEIEDFEYSEDDSRDSSVIVGDKIVLGTKPSEEHLQYQPDNTFAAESDAPPRHETVTILAKIAYSSALARSTKLGVLENALSKHLETTRQIPTSLSVGSRLHFTRSFILRKTGEILSIRAQLNLYSELTDSLPDLFWDSPYNLGLESYYDSLGKALDVNERIKELNRKMDYASDIAGVLRERLSEKHSTELEWLIIVLISIEVCFGIFELWRERNSGIEDERTRELLNEYLALELAKEKSVNS